MMCEWSQDRRYDMRLTKRLIQKMLGTKKPSEVTAFDVSKLNDQYKNFALSTRYNAQCRIRQILGMLGCAANAEGYEILPVVTPREVTVEDADFEAVLEVASPKLRIALLLARDAALRIATICNLKHENIHFNANEIEGKTKRNTTYRVQQTERLRQELEYAVRVGIKSETLLASFNRAHFPPTPNTLSNELWKLRGELGLHQNWSFHDLRRTAARQLYDRTKDLRKVQNLLGHTSLQSTIWYLGNNGLAPTREELEMVRRETNELQPNRN